MCDKEELTVENLRQAKKILMMAISNSDLPSKGTLLVATDNIEYYALKFELGAPVARDYHSKPGVDPDVNNETEVQVNVKEIAQGISSYEPKYSSAIFRIYEDYEKCKKHSSPRVCAGLFVIALARELIPLAGGGS